MTIYQAILKYLADRNDWIPGGTIGRDIGDLLKKKSSNIERRCRELVDSGKIEAELRKIEGVSQKVVFYRITQEKPQIEAVLPQELTPIQEMRLRERMQPRLL